MQFSSNHRDRCNLKLTFQSFLIDFHTDFQENFTIQISGKKKWIFRDSTAFAPLRGCTPHFQTLDKEMNMNTFGLHQNDSDLAEQQLKVLRIGDSSFSANQCKKNEMQTSNIRPSSSSSSSSFSFSCSFLSMQSNEIN